jgi:hypothetical protein
MKRQPKVPLFQEVIEPHLKQRHDPAANKELWLETLGAIQNVLERNEESLRQLGMPKNKRVTRDDRLRFIELMFSYISSHKLLTTPTTASLLTDTDVESMSVALGNFVDEYIGFLDAQP